MNGPPFRPEGEPVQGLILLALPRWVVVAFAGALLLNGFATALIATALVLHLTGR